MSNTRAIYLKVVVDESILWHLTDDEVVREMKIQENLPDGVEVEYLGEPPMPNMNIPFHGRVHSKQQIDEFLNR